MSRKTVIAVIMALAALLLVAPISSVDTEASNGGDYSIVIAGYYDSAHKQTVEKNMDNGETIEASLYFYNECDKDLDVQFEATSSVDKVAFSSVPDAIMVKAHGMSRVTFAISVDNTCNSMQNVGLKLGVLVTKLPDNVTTIEIINFNLQVISEYDSDGAYNKFFGVIDNNLPEPFNTSFTPFIVTMVVVTIVAYLICWLLVPVFANRLDRMTETDDKKKFESILTSLTTLSVSIFVINPGLVILGVDASILDIVFKLSMTAVIMTGSIAIWKVYLFVVENLLRDYEKDEESLLDTSLMPVFRTFGKLIIGVFAIGWLMYIYGFNLQGILVSAGLVSLGITMGAKNILSQFFSGISLLLTKRFKQGDHVKINGEDVIIKRVKLMFTEFIKDNELVITIPNDRVESSMIFNYDTDINL